MNVYCKKRKMKDHCVSRIVHTSKRKVRDEGSLEQKKRGTEEGKREEGREKRRETHDA
jgi:hypothetical protein